MSAGIVEVVSLLLGLGGFGVQANPKAPTADQALEYAVPDADIVAHFDAASVIPGNYKALEALPDQAAIKASPELQKAVRDVVAQVDAPRGLLKGMFGIDIATDVADATAFVHITGKEDDHTVLVTVHGKFTPATIDKIATVVHQTAVKAGAASWVAVDDDDAVAVTKDGVLLAGKTTLVKERIGDGWKTPPHGAGTNLGYAADAINGKPVFALVLTLSPAARKFAIEHHGQNFATDLLKRHKAATFSVYHDGIGWTWIDTTKSGFDSMVQVSDGVVQVLRAAQIAPRGFANIAIGALESYRGTDKRVDELLRHKADLMQLAEQYIGDGNFKAAIDKDPKTMKLSVRLSDRSLSYVLPLGGMLPIGVAGALLMRDEAKPAEPARIATPPAPAKHR
ncbi:MAG: hypothetical protein JO257_14950 [Deltaproteobacteria bacterium]|nr:hypothetical protein [Deltaproteobacteria bacterium]